MPVVYKVTRIDNLAYVGITVKPKTRLWEHKKSKRFEMGIKTFEILFEGSYQECWDKEEEFIKLHDTYKNGLNLTEN